MVSSPWSAMMFAWMPMGIFYLVFYLVFVVPRVFKEATPQDTAAVQPVIDQIVMYPLSKFDGKMKTKDYAKSPNFPVPPAPADAPKGESKWVKPEIYFQELAVVMKEVPPLPGEEALYGWIKSVWDAAEKNPETKKVLVESFDAADKELVGPFFDFTTNTGPWATPPTPPQQGLTLPCVQGVPIG